MTKDLITYAQTQCLNGLGLTREDIIALLDIPAESEAARDLRSAAHEAAAKITKSRAYLWGAVGVDFAPCAMNCDFCSLGAKWRLVKKPFIYSDVGILAHVSHLAENGAHYIVLRTTEFYDVQTLQKLVRKIKTEVPGFYELILNIGEFNLDTALALHEAGVDGIYHSLRLWEGVDTRFKPQERLDTLNAVYRSPLKLIHLVEPIGPEHSPAEIADIFLNSLDYGVAISGPMARVPVKGTPLGKMPMLDANRMAQITAVLRLAAGYAVPDICVHPASAEAVHSGANVVVVETGAIPRDKHFYPREWNRFNVDAAKNLLRNAGYMV